MNCQYEVLSPWAEVDPIPQLGMASRILDLNGKKLGFLRNSKRAARPILEILDGKLKSRFPSLQINHFAFLPNNEVEATPDLSRFESWLKEVDAIILAYGD